MTGTFQQFSANPLGGNSIVLVMGDFNTHFGVHTPYEEVHKKAIALPNGAHAYVNWRKVENAREVGAKLTWHFEDVKTRFWNLGYDVIDVQGKTSAVTCCYYLSKVIIYHQCVERLCSQLDPFN